MITTIAVSVAITTIILLILFIGILNLSQSVVMQDNKTMLVKLSTLTDKYTTDQQQIAKLLTELTLQLNNFSIAIDEVVSSIYDSAMKFPPDMSDMERRPIEFSTDDMVENLKKSKLRLDKYDIKHLKDLFMDIDKISENDYISEEEDPELDD
tara:strand:+ start:247 stop:705 length:459 start_codon:yes stop_codon:yes gene_type:complete